MQVFVLGMHRSGTSVLARILNLIGLYHGGENISTGRNIENPKGFWERYDVRMLNDAILQNSNCDWDCVSKFNIDAISDQDKASYIDLAADIVLNMDAHRPWFIKEPRICILFPIWRKALEVPICIHIHRNPLEAAQSLQARNNLPIDVGLALWEVYNIRALEASSSDPRFVVSYEKILKNPKKATEKICEELSKYGNYNLRIPNKNELVRFVSNNLHRQRHTVDMFRKVATPSQIRLYDLLSDAGSDINCDLTISEDSIDLLEKYEMSLNLIERVERSSNREPLLKDKTVKIAMNNIRLETKLKHDQLMSKYQNILAKHDGLQTKHDDLLAKHDDLRTKNDGLRAEHDGLRTEHDGLRAKHDGLQAEHDGLRAEHDGLRAKHDGLQAEHNDLRTRHDGLRTEHDGLRAEHNGLMAKHDGLMAKHDGLRAEHNGLMAKHDGLMAKHDDLRAKHDDLRAKHDGLRAKHDGLRAKHDELTLEHQNSQSMYRDLCALHGTLQSKHDRLELDLEKLQSKHATRRSHEEELLSKYISLKLRHKETSLKYTEQQSEYTKQQLEYTKQQAEHELLQALEINLHELTKYISNNAPFERAELGKWKEMAEEFQIGIEALLQSNRWRVGNIIVSAGRSLLLKKSGLSAHDWYRDITGRYHTTNRILSNLEDVAKRHRSSMASIVQDKVVSDLIASEQDAFIYAIKTSLQRKFINELADLAKVLIESRRWHWGNALLSIPNQILLRPPRPTIADTFSNMLEELNNYKPFSPYNAQPSGEALLPINPPKPSNDRNVGGDKESNVRTTQTEGLSDPADRNTIKRLEPIDIIVCVHNALAYVKQCLASVITNTTVDYRLIIVNDGSDPGTTGWLRNLPNQYSNIDIIETDGPLGYTRAANRGLSASTASNVVLLNSDTIVPKLWIERMLECMNSAAEIGIVGPLSNTASWQSIPELTSPQGGWAINELPPGYNTDEYAELVYVISDRAFPRVSFVNGFCLMLNRKVIESVGYFDEETFPRGYGEENDYCLRANAAGFELAIADHCFVYHAKSKSYGREARDELSREGSEKLKDRYGLERIKQGEESLRNSEALAVVRSRMRLLLDNANSRSLQSDMVLPSVHNVNQKGPRSVLFVMPARGGGGGSHSVIQEVHGMRTLGIDAKVATLSTHKDDYLRFYKQFVDSGEYFAFYDSDDDFMAIAEHFDVIVATLWSTPALIVPISLRWPNKLYAYYIQDYEPWFFPHDNDRRRVAFDSYTLVPNMVLMAKTDWLCQIVNEKHGVRVFRVSPSLDHDVYFPKSRNISKLHSPKRHITIAAMIRPKTPRRGPLRTLRILREVSKQCRNQVRIVLFGCEDKEMHAYIRKHDPDLTLDFNFDNYGVLTREGVANTLRNADVFADFSDYQAFGRTGLEAMACGCAVVLPDEGGVHEYAIHEENALIVDTRSQSSMSEALLSLVENPSRCNKMQHRALETASKYSILRASISELLVFRAAWNAKVMDINLSETYYMRGKEPSNGEPIRS